MKNRTPTKKLTKQEVGKPAKDTNGKKVKSSCTEYFDEHNIPKDFNSLAKYIKSKKKTNLSTTQIKNILDEINKRGEGAYYSSGSRPGQTPQSWGKARVYCRVIDLLDLFTNLLEGKKTFKSDRDLLKMF